METAGIKRLASDKGVQYEYQMPNALSLFDEEYFEKPYDDDDVVLEENLIVEIKSHAIVDKSEIYYIGKGAAKQRDVSLTAFNNQKVDEDRTYYCCLALQLIMQYC